MVSVMLCSPKYGRGGPLKFTLNVLVRRHRSHLVKIYQSFGRNIPSFGGIIPPFGGTVSSYGGNIAFLEDVFRHLMDIYYTNIIYLTRIV